VPDSAPLGYGLGPGLPTTALQYVGCYQGCTGCDADVPTRRPLTQSRRQEGVLFLKHRKWRDHAHNDQYSHGQG
jgi:hypothetical protein